MALSRPRVQLPPVLRNPVFGYDPDGRLQTVTWDNGHAKSLFYDDNDRLTRIDFVKGPVTSRRDFAYNADGTVATITDTEIS